MRRAAAVGLLLALAGCDAVASLRRLFQGESATGKAGLRVEVVPPDGISILVDGTRVATRSPYVAQDLAPGPHRLEVRGMGYHPVILPMMLKDGESATVPVALRPRATPDQTPQRETLSPSPMPPPAPAPPAPLLPAGVAPITIQLVPEPEVLILLDGAPLAGKQATLMRVEGEMTVGVMTLRYRFGGAGLFELSAAEDGARWWRDGAALKPGGAFKLHRGATRLRRTSNDGTDQNLVIRR